MRLSVRRIALQSDFVKTEAEKCPSVADYPRDLWENVNNKGMGYEVSR